MRVGAQILALAALAAPVAAPASARAQSPTAAGPGCRAPQAAVAHHSAGAVVTDPPSVPPVPCGMKTGFAGGESAVAVTNTGAVFYSPAVQSFAGLATQYFLGGNSGFARTTNLGRSWSFVDPVSTNYQAPTSLAGQPGYPAWDQIDDKFFIDRDTGRLFWADPDLPSEVVLWSDDDGLTWGYSLLAVGFGGEWTQVTTAPPRTSKTSGYPRVVYACGEYDSIGRNGDLCQKSLDGGGSWTAAGQGLFGPPGTSHPQCAGQDEHPNFSPWAAPDSHGRLHELLFCAGKAFLIRSDDEGATWPVVAQIPFDVPAAGPNGTGAAELRTDSADNMYLAWANPGNPNPNGGYQPGVVDLAVSHDLGASWGPAQEVLAPGVEGIRTHFGFDVGSPGHVAFSYLGHTKAHAGFDGYITETFDALAARPLFWSAAVNPASEPPLDSGGKGSSNGLGLDYVSAAIGPDGTPWASFWDACGEDLPAAAACPSDRKTPATTTFGFTDYAGRLTAPMPVPEALAGPRPRRGACIDRRRFTFHLHHPHGERITRARVTINGRLARAVRGRDLSRLTLRRLPRGRFRVRIVTYTNRGTRAVSTRIYRGCTKTPPRHSFTLGRPRGRRPRRLHS